MQAGPNAAPPSSIQTSQQAHADSQQTATAARGSQMLAAEKLFTGYYFTLAGLKGDKEEQDASKLIRKLGGKIFSADTMNTVLSWQKAYAVCSTSMPPARLGPLSRLPDFKKGLSPSRCLSHLWKTRQPATALICLARLTLKNLCRLVAGPATSGICSSLPQPCRMLREAPVKQASSCGRDDMILCIDPFICLQHCSAIRQAQGPLSFGLKQSLAPLAGSHSNHSAMQLSGAFANSL